VCCILVVLALVGPRLALVLLWLFSNYLTRAYDSFVIPFIGFFILPWTTIAYAIAQNAFGGLNALGLIIVILGFLGDIGVIGGGARNRG